MKTPVENYRFFLLDLKLNLAIPFSLRTCHMSSLLPPPTSIILINGIFDLIIGWLPFFQLANVVNEKERLKEEPVKFIEQNK